MEGKETPPSHSSEESSVLDLPSVCDLAECFLPPHSSENSEELFQSMDTIPSSATEENNLPSADAGSCSAGGLEKANSSSDPKAGLGEPPEPSSAALSCIYEDDSAEDSSIRRSLDGFYSSYCQKRPERVDPTCEAAAQCLAQKIAELAKQEGSKYACRCLQMAQVVLREACKGCPEHPTTAAFAKAPAEGVLAHRKGTPGLSDDVLHFLLKQTLTQHSPEK